MNNRTSSPLLPLCEVQHPVADLVKGYLAKGSEWKIDEYFLARTNAHFVNENLKKPVPFSVDHTNIENHRNAARNVRLLSVQANYFRGFRKQDDALDVSQDLVVIDGLNSSGKTSIAEAIEWILTGEISRRQMGDPKELSGCISNRFRPEGENTWVECIVQIDGKVHTLKRELTNDYTETTASRCESHLLMDGQEVPSSAKPIDTVFAGASPILMQQSLREFVFSKPTRRRTYFEQLFNLEDITDLVAKAVVGDIGLHHFGRPDGGDSLAKWKELTELCSKADSSIVSAVEANEEYLDSDTLDSALRDIASAEFGLPRDQDLHSMAKSVEDMQRRARNVQLPLLARLAPSRNLDKAAISTLTEDTYGAQLQSLELAVQEYRIAKQSDNALTYAQDAISRALHILREARLIDDSEHQICPVCEYGDTATLSKHRLDQVTLWDKSRQKLELKQVALQSQLATMSQLVSNLVSLRNGLIPDLISDSDWDSVETVDLADTLAGFRAHHSQAYNDLARFDEVCTKLVQHSTTENMPTDYVPKLAVLLAQLPVLRECARSYSDKYKDLENRVGDLASANPVYAAHSCWLYITMNLQDLLEHFRWETAKYRAKEELDSVRDGLKEFRQQTLESCRSDVSEGMTEVWSILREDVYSGFRKIWIPEPKGKGFPVKMEVKAVLDDGLATHELDALKVMSESQLNAIGVAAFITRSSLLGQRCIVFDDPVQSMDDDHIRSFADSLLRHLGESGFQVIVLTHNDRFSREISQSHFHRCEYVSKRLLFSQEHGIKVAEGNRRVIERLNSAEKLAKQGDLDRAWYFIRLALERLYLLAKIEHGPTDFKPVKWENHAAEAMWNEGVDKIFGRLALGMESRLKSILRMSVPGAHDKTANSQTDVIRAIKDIRPLMNQLRLGDG